MFRLPTKISWDIRESQPSSQVIFLADKLCKKDYMNLFDQETQV